MLKDLVEIFDEFKHLAPWAKALWMSLAVVLPFVGKKLKALYKWKKKQELNKILKGNYTETDLKAAARFYVKPLGDVYRPGSKECSQVQIIRYLESEVFPVSNTDRYFFLLGDSGMGKTTLLINLAQRRLYPSHLFVNYKIALLPVWDEDLELKIQEIRTDAGNAINKIVLLLDSFDEDPLAQADLDSRLAFLTQLTRDFKKVIITSRAQFFDSEFDLPKKVPVRLSAGSGGFHGSTVIRISAFNPKQVRHYFKKRYPLFRWRLYQNLKKRVVAKQIASNLSDITARPLILNYLNDTLPVEKLSEHFYLLFWRKVLNRPRWANNELVTHLLERFDGDYERFLLSQKHLSLSSIYRSVIRQWVQYETEKVDLNYPSPYTEKLYNISIIAALLIYAQHRQSNALSIPRERLFELADSLDIQLATTNISSRSLLYRTANGQFIFAHRSVLEYFLAVALFHYDELLEPLMSEPGWENVKTFAAEIALEIHIKPLFNQLEVSNYTFREGKYNETYHQYIKGWDIKKMGLLKSFYLYGFIGYFDYHIFLPYKKLHLETYINILDYYVFTLCYDYNELVSGLVLYILKHLKDYGIRDYQVEKFAKILAGYGFAQDAVDVLSWYLDNHTSGFIFFTRQLRMDICRSANLCETFFELVGGFYKESEKTMDDLTNYIWHLTGQEYYFEAIETYERHRESFPSNPKLVATIGRAYYHTGDLAKAEYYLHLTNLFDKEISVWDQEWTIRILLESGKQEETLRYIASSKDEIELRLFYGEMLLKSDTAEGLSLFASIQKDRLDLSLIRKLKDIYNEAEEWERYHELLLEISMAPDHTASELNNLACSYSRKGELNKAFEYYYASYEQISSRESKEDKKSNKQTITTNLAVAHCQLAQYEAALKYFEEVKFEDISSDYLLEWMAIAYANTSKYHNAFLTYCRALVLTSKFYYFHEAIILFIEHGLEIHDDRIYKTLINGLERGYHTEYFEKCCDLFSEHMIKTNRLPKGGHIREFTPKSEFFPAPDSLYYMNNEAEIITASD